MQRDISTKPEHWYDRAWGQAIIGLLIILLLVAIGCGFSVMRALDNHADAAASLKKLADSAEGIMEEELRPAAKSLHLTLQNAENNQTVLMTQIQTAFNKAIASFDANEKFYTQSTKDWARFISLLVENGDSLKELLDNTDERMERLSVASLALLERGEGTLSSLQSRVDDERVDALANELMRVVVEHRMTAEELHGTAEEGHRAMTNVANALSPREVSFWRNVASWALEIGDAFDLFNIWEWISKGGKNQ